MYDDDEIREALHLLAERQRFQEINSDPVIRRGRRGVRRRRALASGLAAAMVAAVAVTATSLPDIGASRPAEPAAQPEDGLSLVSGDEAARRCRQQWSAVAGHDVGPVRMQGRHFVHELYERPLLLSQAERAPFEALRRQDRSDKSQTGQPLEWYGFWPGTPEPVLDQQGRKFMCMIPGNLVPTAADLAADAQDGSIPADDAGLLRRCSTIFWHDLTGWRVLARQVEPGAVATVAAMSPSGKLVVHCVIAERSLRDHLYDGVGTRMPSITGVQRPPADLTYYRPSTARYAAPRPRQSDTLPPKIQDYALPPGLRNCDTRPCSGWIVFGSGRMPLNVAKLVAAAPVGRRIEIPVADGWYATAFNVRDFGNSHLQGRLTAYDANGKNLGVVVFHGFTRR